jgi:hypothetical protein
VLLDGQLKEFTLIFNHLHAMTLVLGIQYGGVFYPLRMERCVAFG